MSDEFVISGRPPLRGSQTQTIETEYAVQVDTSGTTTYVGQAKVGSATTDAFWQIQKIDTSSGMTVTWADGGNFTQAWSNRAALTYL